MFEDNTSFLTVYGVGALLSCMDKFPKSSFILSTLAARSLVLSFFDLSSFSSSKLVILLAMKSLNSCFFFLGLPLLLSFGYDLSQSKSFLKKCKGGLCSQQT
jgi:hypothetical protein